MAKPQMEQQLRTAMEHAAPDRLEELLAACGSQNQPIRPFPPPRKKRARCLPLAAAAALAVFFCGAFGAAGWKRANTVDSVVMLDVNPSISMELSIRERVLNVEALNEDARVILQDMDLKGTDVDVAVNALLGSMLRTGYLSDLQNAILVSVENQDADKSAQLQQRITAAIGALFSQDSLEPAVLSQSVSEDEALSALAQTYGISLGKAALIQQVAAQDTALHEGDLAALSVGDIALIAQSRHLQSQAVTQTGTVSDKSCVGQDAACAAAFRHAGVSAAQVQTLEVELDSEDGIMVYEIEFSTQAGEYAYDIGARTGDVVRYQQHLQEPQEEKAVPSKSPAAPAVSISRDAACAAAFRHAGVSAAQVRELKVKLEKEDGRKVYEIEFEQGGISYEYQIRTDDGTILKAEWESGPEDAPERDEASDLEEGPDLEETDDGEHDEDDEEDDREHGDDDEEDDRESGDDDEAEEDEAPSSASGGVKVHRREAIAIALAHAGLSQEEVSGLECKLEKEDGSHIYEIEFDWGGSQYEYEIDAASGKILKAGS